MTEGQLMPEQLRKIRRRVRTVRNTMQITRAMAMVSAAKQRRTQTIFRASQPYAEKLQALLARVAANLPEGFTHPLFEMREPNRVLVVVFAGDRGLAGAFNTRILSKTEGHLRIHGKDRVDLYCIGKRGRDYFRRHGWRISTEVLDLRGRVDTDVVRRVAADLVGRYTRRETDAVFLAYNAVVSAIQYQERFEKFLPLDPQAMKAAGAEVAAVDYILEPNREEVFAQLLPRYVESRLYSTLANTLTAEHSARMIAMNSATTNCEELIDTLTLRMNKARQASITREILDIVGGAEAITS
jgi:F-type H+-transporting ATPase subunit gamma